MPDLTDFLLARITEDEDAARHAADENLEAAWELDKVHEATRLPRQMAVHIARWDPARVLAECEAKRRIVESFALAEATGYRPGTWLEVCELLAAVYADHPDYDETWRVE